MKPIIVKAFISAEENKRDLEEAARAPSR